MVKILASFRRRDELYDANIQVDGKAVWGALSTTYSTFIRALSDELKDAPDARLTFERTDREGLSPWLATVVERDLIRDNPEAYISENTGHDRRVLVRDPAPQSVRVGIRCSYDTLSESFGENVYVRLRDDGKVECPFCGRWRAEVKEYPARSMNGQQCYLECVCTNASGHMPSILPDVLGIGPWVEIPTLALTISAAVRFYIPRQWNDPTGWITRTELLDRYYKYLKETRNV